MKYWIILTLAIILLSCNNSPQNQNNISENILFNVVGKAFPREPIFELPKSSNLPLYSFRVPLNNAPNLPFVDYVVNIVKSTEKVHYVIAERAYQTIDECSEALAAAKHDVLAAYPNIRSDGKSPISYKEGDLSIDFACMAREGSRYMVLTLSIFSKSQSAILNGEF